MRHKDDDIYLNLLDDQNMQIKKKLEHDIISTGIKKFSFEINDLFKKNIINPKMIMIIEKVLFNSKKK